MKFSSSVETESTMSWCKARRSWWLPETYHVSLLRRRNAYNMVINKFGDRLYNGLVQTQTEHLRVVAAKIEAAQGETFLRELKLRWDHHNKSMQMIRDILMVRRQLVLPLSSQLRASARHAPPFVKSECPSRTCHYQIWLSALLECLLVSGIIIMRCSRWLWN